MVVDTNILISAILKDGLTRNLIETYNGRFLLPSYGLEEVENHRVTLCRRTRLSSKEFVTILERILEKMRIVPEEALHPFKLEAYEIIKEIDLWDIHFIACALAFPGSILWSDDKALQKQRVVPVFTTSELCTLVDNDVR